MNQLEKIIPFFKKFSRFALAISRFALAIGLISIVGNIYYKIEYKKIQKQGLETNATVTRVTERKFIRQMFNLR